MDNKFTPLRVTIAFLVFGLLWVIISDLVPNVVITSSSALIRFYIYKATVFILLLSAGLYWLANRYWTNLTKTKLDLEEQYGRYRLLTDIATDAIIIIDADSTILFANPATGRIFGYDLGEILNKPLIVLMPEEHRQRHLNSIRDHIETGRKHISWSGIELPGLHKNGTRIPLEMSFGEYKKNGKYFFFGIIRDITERKKFERSLYDEKEFSDEVINSLPGIFYISDVYGNFIKWNKNLVRVTGFADEEISRKKLLDLFMSEDKKIIAEKMREVFIKGKTSIEVDLVIKSGEAIPYYLTGIRFIKSDQLYLVGEGIDITERKKAEEALKQADKEIRQAYVDVFSAVTGGKLILMTKDELKQALGKPVIDTFLVPADKFLTEAREKLKRGLSQFPAIEDIDGVILAANEALTNAIKHAGGGHLRIFRAGSVAQIMVSDSGPGIDFSILPKATLLSGFSTKQTLGMGFSIMLEICDKVLLSTEPGSTDIVLEINTEEGG